MLYYPLPIVFYVHPAQPQLQEVIQKGLLQIDHNGGLERLYQKHYGKSVLRMNPKQRKVIPLVNKQLSDEWNEFKPMYLE